jgi:hypothetical protein
MPKPSLALGDVDRGVGPIAWFGCWHEVLAGAVGHLYPLKIRLFSA